MAFFRNFNHKSVINTRPSRLKSKGRIFLYVFFAGVTSLTHAAENELHLALLQQLRGFEPNHTSQSFTVIDKDHYQQTVAQSRTRVKKILTQLKPARAASADQQIAFIVKQLSDTPYLASHAMGEGDWQPKSVVYRSGAAHIKQDPVYRLDKLDCQTFVQVSLALLKAKNIDEFDQAYLKIAYGAAGNPEGEIVRYYNRNNFIDADFNPVNERNGLLSDASEDEALLPYRKTLSATITRQRWFTAQQQNLKENVRVLDADDGKSMATRLTQEYAELPFPQFKQEKIKITYIPKSAIAIREPDGEFMPNQALLDAIPTPGIAEIVREPNRWNLYGRKIKDMIGSELTISHLGLLYRQTFKKNEVIYQKTTCEFDEDNHKFCDVTPVKCEQAQCRELMFAHATDAYPFSFSWQQKQNGEFACAKGDKGQRISACNRVVTVPFFDYLTNKQLGFYTNMDLGSVIGVHFEKLR